MANIKIENYEGDADTFTFPYNPETFDDSATINNQITEFPLKPIHYAVMGRGINPKKIVMNGHFTKSDKRENYNKLASHLRDKRLKKLYFADDRFYIGIGSDIKQTNTGSRQNFIDYVASFNSIVGIVQGNTQRRGVYDVGTSTWSNTDTNQGNTTNFVEYVNITLGSGGSSGDTVTISDNQGNGITITLDSYNEDDILTLSMITTRDIGNNIVATKIFDADLKGNAQTTERAAGKKSKFLEIVPEENIDTFSLSETASVKEYEVLFRDGYMG